MKNMSEHNGVTKRPSPRKPLHSSCENCVLTNSLPLRENMGRYGIVTDKSRNLDRPMAHASASEFEGIDEPDNVLSKPQRSFERVSRRHSIDSLKQRGEISNDSDNDIILSKSTPEFLQLYSHCSDESDASDTRETHSTPVRSVNSPKSNRNQYILNQDYQNTYIYSHESEVYYRQYIKYSAIVIGVIAVIIALNYNNEKIMQSFNFNHEKVYSDYIYDKSKFFNDVSKLGQKYNASDNSILQIKSGIATIFQRQDTGSFIFTYNSQNSSFNPIIFDKFMNELTTSSTRFLRNSSNIHEPVIVDSSKLDMRVHSELIEKYKEEVRRTGVMLVKDLDEVPSFLAMAFHYYCDEFNPLIKKSAIFFTLDMAKCSDQKTSHASIEKCLASKWTAVPPDNIVPLLTRVVGIVVNIYH